MRGRLPALPLAQGTLTEFPANDSGGGCAGALARAYRGESDAG